MKTAIALVLGAWSLTISLAQEPTPRMSLANFTADPNRVAALKRGVKIMKERKPSDPKSWFFQASIHGVTDEAVAEALARDPEVAHVDQAKFWNRCPHNGEPSADFLIWHRAYTYYFERILREASGDPTLSIPYWDYTGEERAFPRLLSDPERDPQTEEPTNPLYNEKRELVFMVGLYELADRVVSTSTLFAEKNFFGETEDRGFAGGVGDSERGTQGLVERQPHNLLHVAIGGVIGDTSGSMAEVSTAAHDPIFWLHHTNIDRLWAKWDALEDRSWGSVPPISWFHERPWHFHDVDGTVKNEPRHHYLRYRTIGTTYDDDVADAKRLSDKLPIDEIRAEILLTEAGLVSPVTDVRKLSSTANTVIPLARPDGADLAAVDRLRVEEKAKKPKLLLELTFTPPRFAPNVAYDVFLPKKGAAAEELKPGAPTHLGALILFGTDHPHGTSHPHARDHAAGTFTQTFDISHLAAEDPDFDLDKRSVVVQPYDMFKPMQAGLPRSSRTGDIVITAVRVVTK